MSLKEGKTLLRRAGVAAGIAFAILIADYLIGNWEFPVFDDSSTLQPLALMASVVSDDKEEDDSIFCVNLGVEKELVAALDPEFGDSIGHVAVTSRQSLRKAMGMARKAGAKNIFVDVSFSRNLSGPQDSALFAEIAADPRIVVATHAEDLGEVPDAIASNVAFSDYRGLKTNGFTRYQYLQSYGESAALRLYRQTTGACIRRHGAAYSDDGRLCYNSLFIRLPKSAAERTGSDGLVRYPYFYSQILGNSTDEEVCAMMRGKTVLIGDFDNDLHETYVGQCPGPMINYHAYKALLRGDHLVKFWPGLLLLLVYSIMFYFLLWPVYPRISMLGTRLQNILGTVAEIIGFGGIICVVRVVWFSAWHVSIIAALPATVATLIILGRRLGLKVGAD